MGFLGSFVVLLAVLRWPIRPLHQRIATPHSQQSGRHKAESGGTVVVKFGTLAMDRWLPFVVVIFESVSQTRWPDAVTQQEMQIHLDELVIESIRWRRTNSR